MNRIYTSFVFLALYALSVAQPSDDFGYKEEHFREKFSVKIGILPIMDFVSPSLNIAVENRLSQKLGLHQEVGYINNYINPIFNFLYKESFEATRNINGVKYFVEPRIYFKPRINPHLFFAPSIYYKFFTSNTEVEMMRFNGQYFQMMDFRRNLHQLSFLLKVGNTIDIDSEKLGMDLSGGIGLRHFWINDNLPADAQPAQNRLILQRPNGQYWRPVIYLGMALRILPKKNKAISFE